MCVLAVSLLVRLIGFVFFFWFIVFVFYNAEVSLGSRG